ncbi:MAG: phenylalanine--tRNA ligase subunit beta, partial [Rhodanobacteraceae bacterium]
PRGAIERATALLLELAGGTPGEVIEAVAPDHLPRRAAVLLRRARLARVLGVEVADAEVERILTGLGMRVEPESGGWRATPPPRRFDIEREEDLIEEVARIHGYDAIPASLPAGAPPVPRSDESIIPVSALAEDLAARDYHEAICYAFVDPQLLHTWRLDAGAVTLANPLSADLATMRTSLLPGLVEALRRNCDRQQARVRMFETGVVFESRDRGPGTGDRGAVPIETGMLAAVACGNAHAEQWGEPKRALDFHDIKGDLAALIARSGAPREWSFDTTELPSWLHPGRGARLLRGGVPVGAIGELHPALQRDLDVASVHAFELTLESLIKRLIPQTKQLPRFPSIRRDIAVEVDADVQWARVARAIRSTLPATLDRVVLFDDFRGPGL